ncbi:hypothetical protein UCRPC4_g04556 [Phaeomoniella chlamydospora]|uniref:Zn(2)-C6 fungal-type domain-containing protein n=1 Tax=Phaeomoniella chlamydospora TaxID=158046 RepID=A0A0G2E846_PHACM|nr:hypothetical protein UCRPC4_g04556 [Phaeomoniella chlamydospora]
MDASDRIRPDHATLSALAKAGESQGHIFTNQVKFHTSQNPRTANPRFFKTADSCGSALWIALSEFDQDGSETIKIDGLEQPALQSILRRLEKEESREFDDLVKAKAVCRYADRQDEVLSNVMTCRKGSSRKASQRGSCLATQKKGRLISGSRRIPQMKPLHQDVTPPTFVIKPSQPVFLVPAHGAVENTSPTPAEPITEFAEHRLGKDILLADQIEESPWPQSPDKIWARVAEVQFSRPLEGRRLGPIIDLDSIVPGINLIDYADFRNYCPDNEHEQRMVLEALDPTVRHFVAVANGDKPAMQNVHLDMGYTSAYGNLQFQLKTWAFRNLPEEHCWNRGSLPSLFKLNKWIRSFDSYCFASNFQDAEEVVKRNVERQAKWAKCGRCARRGIWCDKEDQERGMRCSGCIELDMPCRRHDRDPERQPLKQQREGVDPQSVPDPYEQATLGDYFRADTGQEDEPLPDYEDFLRESEASDS